MRTISIWGILLLLIALCVTRGFLIAPSLRNHRQSTIQLSMALNANVNQLQRKNDTSRADRAWTQRVAENVGVEPPQQAPAHVWKRAWNLFKFVIPVLHMWDRHQPPNSSLDLYCLWWKALSGNDPRSPVYDDRLVFDLLPRGTRHFAKTFRRFFPRLHHANVEIRTAFLDREVTTIAREQHARGKRVRLISLGSGYDVRSIKLCERGVVDEAYELDLPEVVAAKHQLLTSRRFRQRRPHVNATLLPTTMAVDLNNVSHVQTILQSIVEKDDDDDSIDHTVFLFEAVLIYLDEGVPTQLLQLCSSVMQRKIVTNTTEASLVFADRLEHMSFDNLETEAQQQLKRLGWNLVEWLPKPGLARHMGRAELVNSN